MPKFNRNTDTVKKIYDDFKNGSLTIDDSYQRRKIWGIQDKIRLIETILLELLMPEIFLWTSNIDPETGIELIHIVDGQQRITAIVDFINNEYCLSENALTNDFIKEKFKNKSFDALDNHARTLIWGYELPIVKIDKKYTPQNIRDMFYRLNMTSYALNTQEKLNSKTSVFGDKCIALSELDFWKYKKIFSANDAKRMLDVTYCCGIYILASEGIIDQTNQSHLNKYYDDYAEEFDANNELYDKIVKAMNIIDLLEDKSTFSFISKKAQMYTLFCVAFKMIEHNTNMTQEIFERFKSFVATYSSFRNEFQTDDIKDTLRNITEQIKKYKLSSSEGINKKLNRSIRFEILYKICISGESSSTKELEELNEIFKSKLEISKGTIDKLESDDFDIFNDDTNNA